MNEKKKNYPKITRLGLIRSFFQWMQKHPRPRMTGLEFVGWLIVLFVFATFYNRYTDWLIYKQGKEHGYTDMLVAFGVMVTSIPATRFLTPWEYLRCFLLFIASGSWMMYGHWRREKWDEQRNQANRLALESKRRAGQI